MDVGLLILRAVVGALFVGHGTQKLLGWFGGHGLDGTGGFFESVGYRPGRQHAAVAGAAEALGGALLVLGLLTPLGAAVLIGVMINAMVSVHWPNIWNTDGGIELPLVMATAATCLAFTGAGAASLDNALGLELHGAVWGFTALVLGFLGGCLVLATRETEEIEIFEDFVLADELDEDGVYEDEELYDDGEISGEAEVDVDEVVEARRDER